jgi:hypothetical protein
MNQHILSRKHLQRITGGIIAILSLFFIIQQLWQSWPELGEIQIRIPLASLSLLFAGFSLTLYALLWQNTLQRLGTPLSRSLAVQIWFLSQIVRYVPGNIWHLLGRAYLARQEGVETLPLSLSMMLEIMQTITAALIITAVSLIFWQPEIVSGIWLLSLVPLLSCYVWPQLLRRPITLVLKITRQKHTFFQLQRKDLLALLPGYCFTWLAYGFGLYILVYSIHPLPLAVFPSIAGIFAVAWVVGFLSFLTPSGLGVREGVLGYLLAFLMPTPIALLIALLARIWLTLAELGCTAIALWMKKL